jgi:hypothetical protein
MKSILKSLLMLYLICLWSCGNNTDKKNSLSKAKYLISINEDSLKQIKIKKLSEIIEKYHFIKLETTKESLLGEIKKIMTFEENVFILEARSSNGIKVFNNKGKYLYKIGREGSGPGEFVRLKGFTINESNRQLILLDSEGKKLLYFSIEGKLLKEKHLKYGYSNIEILDDNYIALICTGIQSGYDLSILNMDGETIKNFFTRTPYNEIDIFKPLIRYDDSLLYMQANNDTIYTITPNYTNVYAIVDYGKYRVTKDKLVKSSFGGIMVPKEFCMKGTRFYTETEKLIYFVFDYDKMNSESPFYVIYSKMNKKQYIFTNSIIDDITFYQYAPQIETVSSKNEFISIIQPYILLESMNEERRTKESWDENTKHRFEKMEEIVTDIDEASNPILFFATIKEIK